MLTKGQTLWYVPAARRFGNPMEVTVDSVGRKWASIGRRDRIDINTLRIDGRGYSSPGRCYLSKEKYEKEELLLKTWAVFINQIYRHIMPPRISTEDILAARKLLKMDEE